MPNKISEDIEEVPTLYLVGTPIGNLDDISFRAVETLKKVAAVFAEDTRHTRKLLNRYEIQQNPISCHKFSEASRVGMVLDYLSGGQSVALVSDAGMPGISDPGSRLVRACREAGYRVTSIPGPSSVCMAAALSGLADHGFLFKGFLSNKSAARSKALDALSALDTALVLFESPHRIIKLLDAIEASMGDRQVFVGRELTKKFEECRVGTASEIKQAYANRTIKGEVVVVIAPADKHKRPPKEEPLKIRRGD